MYWELCARNFYLDSLKKIRIFYYKELAKNYTIKLRQSIHFNEFLHSSKSHPEALEPHIGFYTFIIKCIFMHLSNTCTYTHTQKQRDRERYTQRNNKYQVPVKSMIELKLIKQLAWYHLSWLMCPLPASSSSSSQGVYHFFLVNFPCSHFCST